MICVLANLDCEVEWAGAPPLPAPVRAAIAALGSLCRVLGDVVETIEPVEASRAPGATLIARGAALPEGPVIAWGATARWPSSGDVEIARRAADRRLAATLEDELGTRPTGAAIVRSLDELVDALPAAAAPTGRWVAKAMICAAGRDRVHRRGTALDDATRTRLTRLLARGGGLALEPWLDRVLDLGQCAELARDGTIALYPPHRLLCDERGGFTGIAIDDPDAAAHARDLAHAAHTAGAALARIGYAGPFTIDGFVARTPRGLALRPLVEVNPRLSFGRIARAWVERLGGGGLEVGRGAPPADARPLLLPGAVDGDPTSAWLTSSGASRSPAR